MAAVVAPSTPKERVPNPRHVHLASKVVFLLPRGCAAPSTTPAVHVATQARSTDSEVVVPISSTKTDRCGSTFSETTLLSRQLFAIHPVPPPLRARFFD
jgi:hypothetical protein